MKTISNPKTRKDVKVVIKILTTKKNPRPDESVAKPGLQGRLNDAPTQILSWADP